MVDEGVAGIDVPLNICPKSGYSEEVLPRIRFSATNPSTTYRSFTQIWHQNLSVSCWHRRSLLRSSLPSHGPFD